MTSSGVTTLSKHSKSISGKRTRVTLNNVSESTQDIGRPLLTPDEVMRLPEDDALIFVANMNPIYAKKIKYYEDPNLSRKTKLPPPQKSDTLSVGGFEMGFPDIDEVSNIEIKEEQPGPELEILSELETPIEYSKEDALIL